MISGARSAGLTPATPPATDQIEICLFGPGVGESILVHTGCGRWICIDCAKFKRRPWPVQYLNSIGVPPEAIDLIVATHWHSDHVDGISGVVKEFPLAKFACSRALRIDEFKQILVRYEDVPDVETLRAPLREMQEVFRIYASRMKSDPHYPAPTLAGNKQVLHQDTGGRIDVWALSPSDADVLKALDEFKKLFIPEGEVLRGISPIDQNHACVVIAIRIDDQWLLFGSDLEMTSSCTTGWNAIIGAPLSQLRPASAFKIPHHGSQSAFSAAVWASLVDPAAVAVLTPYTRSSLPRQAQIDQFKRLGRRLYITSSPTTTPAARAPESERMIKKVTTKFVPNSLPGFGYVRLRKRPLEPQWDVKLEGTAQQL